MKDKLIGVFDSGLGGLTALSVIHQIMPAQGTIYFADTVNVPYGDKTDDDVLRCVDNNISFLKSKGAKAILFACGTASSLIKKIDNQGLPVCGVIEPSCHKALSVSKNLKIGVLATAASIRIGTFRNTILKMNPKAEIFEQPCPGLADLIEKSSGDVKDKKVRNLVELYTSKLVGKGIDTIILGCTHYPLVLDLIREYFKGEDINFVDCGKEAAYELKNILKKSKLLSEENSVGTREYFVSGDKDDFSSKAHKILKKDISVFQIER